MEATAQGQGAKPIPLILSRAHLYTTWMWYVRSCRQRFVPVVTKENSGNARRKERGAWQFTIAVSKSSLAAKASLP